MKVYIYALIDPRTDEVRYIGKSVDPAMRYWGHMSPSRQSALNTFCSRWIGTLLRGGMKPRMTILQECSDADWREAEMRQISLYRQMGCPLTNITDGGEGLHGVKRGPISESQKAKLREARKRYHVSDESRAKMAASRTGVRQSPETVAKRAAKLRGMKRTPEQRARMGEAHRGHNLPPGCFSARWKVTNEQVAEIRNRVAAGERGVDLATEFGVSPSLVQGIVHGRHRLDAAGPISSIDLRRPRKPRPS